MRINAASQALYSVLFVLENVGIALTFAVIALAGVTGQPAQLRAALVIAAGFGICWSATMRYLRKSESVLRRVSLAHSGPTTSDAALLCVMLCLVAIGGNPAFRPAVQAAMQTAVLLLGVVALQALGVERALVLKRN